MLAAIFTGGLSAFETESFDIALFGRTVAHQRRSDLTFDPSGAFGRGSGPPKLAGALAFVGLGWRGRPDPILYLHPRFTGLLPEAVTWLRTRRLEPSGIVETPPQRTGLLMELGWPTS